MSVCDTDPRSTFTVLAGGPVSDPEVLALYESVGWGAYTRGSQVLAAGQRAFYEALGFTEGSDFRPEPVRVFAQFR